MPHFYLASFVGDPWTFVDTVGEILTNLPRRDPTHAPKGIDPRATHGEGSARARRGVVRGDGGKI